jgi:outer membrane protein assembly factor BamB
MRCIIAGNRNTYVLRLTNGSVVWQHSPGWAFPAFPETMPGVLFVGGGQSIPSNSILFGDSSLTQHFIYAVSANDGSVLWGVPMGPVQRPYPHFIT